MKKALLLLMAPVFLGGSTFAQSLETDTPDTKARIEAKIQQLQDEITRLQAVLGTWDDRTEEENRNLLKKVRQDRRGQLKARLQNHRSRWQYRFSSDDQEEEARPRGRGHGRRHPFLRRRGSDRPAPDFDIPDTDDEEAFEPALNGSRFFPSSFRRRSLSRGFVPRRLPRFQPPVEDFEDDFDEEEDDDPEDEELEDFFEDIDE